MDEPTDSLIYMACVALGFSLIENYFYAVRNPSTTPLIAIRLIICTPMHIAFSIFLGWPSSGHCATAEDGTHCCWPMSSPAFTIRSMTFS